MRPILLLLSFFSAAIAGDWRVSVEARCIDLPRETALGLADEFARPETANAAMKKLDAMILGGSAALRGIVTAIVKDGAGFMGRSGSDEVYGTDFYLEDRRINQSKQAKGATLTYPTTSFERQFSGCSLALSCLVSGDGATVYMQGALENSTRGTDRKLECAVRTDGATKVVHLPEFTKLNSHIGFVATAGVPTIAGIHLLPDKRESLQLHILTATTRKRNAVGVESPVVEKDGMGAHGSLFELPQIENAEGMRLSLASYDGQAKVELRRVRIRDGNVAAAFDVGTVQRLLKTGDAEVIAIHEAVLLQDRPVDVRTYYERWEPTELEPLNGPPTFYRGPPPEKSDFELLKARLAKPLMQLTPQPSYRSKRRDLFLNPPTSFEIHELGSSLHSEWILPTVESGDLIVSLNHSIRTFVSGEKQLLGPDSQGDHVVVSRDKFKYTAASTSCTFKSGKWKTLWVQKAVAGSTDVTIACATLIPFNFTLNHP